MSTHNYIYPIIVSSDSDDLSALLTILPFHDDPYIKVMQAYNTTNNESHIPLPLAPIAPPTVLPSSPVFEIGESSHKTHLERHKKQIENTLNHLDELPLERIEHMEDKIEGLDIMDMINDQGIEHTISPTPSPDYPLMSYLSGRGMKPLKSEQVPETPNKMAPKRTSTSAAPAMTQAAIRKLLCSSRSTNCYHGK
ncbi:hypothetical protein Tco_1421025 [Tanacetum coccineum]